MCVSKNFSYLLRGRKKEEGRRKKEEGRRKKEEGNSPAPCPQGWKFRKKANAVIVTVLAIKNILNAENVATRFTAFGCYVHLF
jgi:hypothetical protein